MTREEAIADIRDNIKPVVGGISLDMAIEALEKQSCETSTPCEYAEDCKKMKAEPCEDCISRQAVLGEINKVGVKVFETYDDYSQVYDFVDTLPPVKPKKKTGKWVFVQRGKYVDIKCSECENVRVKECAYNYTVEQVLADKENIAELLAEGDMQWCPYCGTKMIEPQESEDKG